MNRSEYARALLKRVIANSGLTTSEYLVRERKATSREIAAAVAELEADGVRMPEGVKRRK